MIGCGVLTPDAAGEALTIPLLNQAGEVELQEAEDNRPNVYARRGEPDVVLSMTEDCAIPADGTVPYKYYAVPTNFTEDKYVQFAEIKRGERSVVHHVIVSVREPDQGPLPPAGEIKIGQQRANPEDTWRELQQSAAADGPQPRDAHP